MSSTATTSTAVPPHRPCSELENRSTNLDDNSVHRLVLGTDDTPHKLSAEEAQQQLGDRFAQLVLLNGVFPRNAGAVLKALEDAVPPGDPLRAQQFFLVGEGMQIAPAPGVVVERNLRFLATAGQGPGGPDIMLSAFNPDHGTVEVMAWDETAGGFNYYRTVGESSAWVFAGNSRHALTPPTRDNGPFESHKSGHFLMKELRLPWIHWDSPTARAVLSIFAEQDMLDHPWVANLAPGGAYTLEEDVAIPSMQRWTAARLAALVAGASEEAPRRVVEQLVTSLTVNLASSNTSSAAGATGSVDRLDLPETFFVDSAALSGVLGLASPPRPFVASALYTTSLQTFGAHLTDVTHGGQFDRPGDTHFAFVVPERAFEDTETVRQAIELGIVSRRLAACLLMVDFPNPVFSDTRAHLLQHVPDTPFDADRDFSQEVADAIVGSAAAQQPGTPEHEFSQLWDAGEDFEPTLNALLQDYYDAFSRQLTTEDGFNSYAELAESRREKVRGMPIAESPLLFATFDIEPLERRMRTDGTVEVV